MALHLNYLPHPVDKTTLFPCVVPHLNEQQSLKCMIRSTIYEAGQDESEYTPPELKELAMETISAITTNVTIYTDGFTSKTQQNIEAGLTIWDHSQWKRIRRDQLTGRSILLLLYQGVRHVTRGNQVGARQ